MPKDPSYIDLVEIDLNKTRKSYIKNAIKHVNAEKATKEDLEFLAEETKSDFEFVKEVLDELDINY